MELTVYGQPVRTVFDLLGHKENDLTRAVGWGLANSHTLALMLLADVFCEADAGEISSIQLQERIPERAPDGSAILGKGFTDIEVHSEYLHLIIEAKVGWTLPEIDQLQKYAATHVRRSATAVRPRPPACVVAR